MKVFFAYYSKDQVHFLGVFYNIKSASKRVRKLIKDDKTYDPTNLYMFTTCIDNPENESRYFCWKNDQFVRHKIK